jgi:hypothetical protein
MVEVVSGIEHIRQRPQMYFAGEVTPGAICSYLADDALGLGAAHVRIDRVERWSIVSADVDWLRLPEHRVIALDRLFVGMHAQPSRGGRIRSEVFVGAFAETAYVGSPREFSAVVGDAPLPETVARVLCPPPCVRSIVTPMFVAAANQRYELVYDMLKAGADPTIRMGKSGKTILSVIRGSRVPPGAPPYEWQLKVVDVLKQKGFDVEHGD